MANPIPDIETFQATRDEGETLAVCKNAKYSKEPPPATRSGLSLIWEVASRTILSPFTLLYRVYFLAGDGMSWIIKKAVRFFISRCDSNDHFEKRCNVALVGLSSNNASVYQSSLKSLAEEVERGQNLASAGQYAQEAMLNQDVTVRSAGKALFSALFKQGLGYLSAIKTIQQTALNKYDRFYLAKELLWQTKVYSNELIAIANDGLKSSDPEILHFSVNLFRLLVENSELFKVHQKLNSDVLHAVKLGFSDKSPLVKESALQLASELVDKISTDSLINIVTEALDSGKIDYEQIEGRLFAALVEKGSPSGYESGRSSTEDSDTESETETSTDEYELPIMTSSPINPNIPHPIPIPIRNN